MRFKALIFDWDGTLVDSLDHIVSSLRRAAADQGLPVRPDEALRDIIGLGMVEALDRLYPGIDKAQILALRDLYAGHFFSQEVSTKSLFPGVQEMLPVLTERGHQLAVATGKSRRGLDWALKTTGLGDFFPLTRCADETRSKPDPLMLQEILTQLALAPAQAVMVGDTIYDLEMAQRIGMPAIGVTWGVHSPEQLLAYKPLAVVNSVAELSSLLLS